MTKELDAASNVNDVVDSLQMAIEAPIRVRVRVRVDSLQMAIEAPICSPDGN